MRLITRAKIAVLKYLMKDYVFAHLASREWHVAKFAFISDIELRERLADEFLSARYIYKSLAAVGADDWLQRAQVRIQVLMYASVYEAALHHILFENLADDPRVKDLKERPAHVKVDIPAAKKEAIRAATNHNGREIVTFFKEKKPQDETKIRFDDKAKCALALGIIDNNMCNDLIAIYEARNAIHIHAEIRKSISYELELSKKCYRRIEPFSEQVTAFFARKG